MLFHFKQLNTWLLSTMKEDMLNLLNKNRFNNFLFLTILRFSPERRLGY